MYTISLKRLKRMCNKIQFIASSATLENAVEFCEKLFNVKMKLILGEGKERRNRFSDAFSIFTKPKSLND